MSARASGAWLIAAAGLFWLSWLLMPGVGITDAERILALVSSQPARVRASVAMQLLSAACYAPALLGCFALAPVRSQRWARIGAALLLIGAMGSAADAVFHLLAVEMVRPGIDRSAVLPLMERMQGAGLLFIAPLIAAFFLGSWLLSLGCVRADVLPRTQLGCFGLALAVGVLGGALAAGDGPAARAVGLAVLASVSSGQAWIGFALRRL